MITDACAMTWSDSAVFVARATALIKDNEFVFESSAPITCEIKGKRFVYYTAEEAEMILKVAARPKEFTLNGAGISVLYDSSRKSVDITLPAGENVLTIK